MNIKQSLKENPILLFLRVIPELFNEAIRLVYGLGNSHTHSMQKKFEASITISYHGIEKGMCLPSPRTAFGENKIFSLIAELNKYKLAYPGSDFIKKPIGTIAAYLEFNKSKGYVNKEIESKLNILMRDCEKNDQCFINGIKSIKKEEIVNNSCIDFKTFTLSRHSIRNFSKEDVSDALIIEALEIAKNTPSSCNRQPWKTYIFKDKTKKNSLLNFQGGNNGFMDSIRVAILITSDLNNYFINEIHQAYIDGGLYAMTLIYAFHSLGIGTIPLTTSFKQGKSRLLHKEFNIPVNESLIMIVGIGHLPEKFNVACSVRKNIEKTSVFI